MRRRQRAAPRSGVAGHQPVRPREAQGERPPGRKKALVFGLWALVSGCWFRSERFLTVDQSLEPKA